MSDRPAFDPLRPGRAHFVGIGGVGMAGVARLLRGLGWEASGCDAHGGPLLDWLADEGVRVFRGGHDPAHVAAERPDVVVRTPAVDDRNPELAAARAAGVPILARGEALAALSALHETYAVCGSHGKTTTSTFLAIVLRAHHPEGTLWCIGGTSAALGPVAGGVPGPSPDRTVLVAESDESDGTLALYAPAVTVLTNLDLDHVDHFPSTAAFEKVFSDVIARTSRALVFCADHPRAAAVAAASRHPRRVSYGFSPGADFRLLRAEPEDGGVRAALRAPDGAEISFRLPVPGRHNALNAAGAIAAATLAGVPPAEAARTLEEFAALPARRFERVGSPDGFEVVSDYSHHPSEIRALIETARGVAHKRLVGVFQPHRFTRTRTLRDEFPPAFRGLDELVLCPVYAASEPPIEGGSSAALYAAFRTQAAEEAMRLRPDAPPRRDEPAPADAAPSPAPRPSRGRIPVPVFAESLDDALAHLRATLRRGDLVLVIGAGDVGSLAPRIAALRPVEAPPTPMVLSAYGTRAAAPRFRVLPSLDALRAALADAAAAGESLTMLGAGTNTLVAATGCERPLARLRGPDFAFLKALPPQTPDATELEAGAATSGAALLEHCRAHGLSGLEPLVGIPGQVGGWLAMNAGTRFGSFCDRVVSVRALRADGSETTLTRDALRPAYRACPGLAGFVAVSVRLRLDRSTPEEVEARMLDFSQKRLSFAGLRTCGSVFKNPPAPGPTAGQLADRALCKGLRVGGAHVTARHANVVATDATATPSDVQALLHLVADRVEAASGIRLEPEIRLLH